MTDLGSRICNVKWLLRLALAGFLFTFIIPWIIFILHPSVAVFFIMSLGAIAWMVSSYMMSNQFNYGEHERWDCRIVGLMSVPLILLFFIVGMILSSHNNVFRDYARLFFNGGNGDISVFVVLSIICASHAITGYKLSAIRGPKGLKTAGYGFYGMAAVIAFIALGIIGAQLLPEVLMFLLSIASLILVIIGLSIGSFSTITNLGSETNTDEIPPEIPDNTLRNSPSETLQKRIHTIGEFND